MKNIFKKPLLIIMMIFMLFALVGCGGSNKTEVENVPQTETIKETTEENVIEETKEEVTKYPNVKGYPIEKDDIKLCRVFINGYEYCSDGYIKNNYPDVVYMVALEMVYDGNAYGNGVVVDEDGEVAFGACINGKLIVNRLGESILNIDGEIYEDLAPEKRIIYKDNNDYFCTTLFLEKALGAKVNFSEDRSAVYIETSEKIDEEKSQMYELDLSGYGKLVAKNIETEEKLILKCGDDRKNSSGGSNTKGGSNNTSNSHQICSACGGSGKTYGVQNVYNPVTNSFEFKSTFVTCISCGGTGRR